MVKKCKKGNPSMKYRRICPLLILIISTLACNLSSGGNHLRDLGGGDEPLPPDVDIGVPLPPNEDFGVLCFIEFEDSIAASAPAFDVFYSRDGGLTWEQEGFDEGGASGSLCNPGYDLPKELWVPPNGMERYRFNPGETIEISVDKGQSWQVAYDLSQIQWEPASTPAEDRQFVVRPGPLDAMIDPYSGNLLLAMGHAGVLLRLPSGEWRWVKAGQYANEAALNDTDETSWDDLHVDIQISAFVKVSPEIEVDTETNFVDAMAFSPDGAVLAVSGFDGGVKLYDFIQSDRLYWHTFGKEDRNWRLYGLSYSPDGDTLVTCGTNVDQTLMIWDVQSWELIKSYKGFQTSTLDTGAHAGRQYLAIAFGADPQNKDQVKLFRLPEGDELNIFSSQQGSVTSLFFIPETPLLAVARDTGSLEVWDIEKGETMPFSPTTAVALGYHSSKDLLMGLRPDGLLTAWDMSTGNLAWQLALQIPHGWRVNTGVFSDDGRRVAVGMHNGPLLVFDSSRGELYSRQWIKDGGTLQKLAFSPDGQWLAAGFTTGKVRIWRVDHLMHQD
jgi:hypothetical protein